MKSLRIILFFIIIFISQSLFSYIRREDIKIEIKFYAQSYNLNSDIMVNVSVVNISSYDISFYVSDLIYETFFIKVRTPKNEEVDLKDEFKINRRRYFSNSGDNRKIILKPGESFSKNINIADWYNFLESGYYYITAIFYPNPDLPNYSYESENYRIHIKPPVIIEKVIQDTDRERKELLEKLKTLPPYDVIADIIDARMKKDWERFFIHIDVEKLIMAFSDYWTAYNNATTAQIKFQILEDFKKYLTVHWQDRILSYRIKETTIKEDVAEVICDVRYKVGELSYGIRYNFYLYKDHRGKWLMKDYTALRID